MRCGLDGGGGRHKQKYDLFTFSLRTYNIYNVNES